MLLLYNIKESKNDWALPIRLWVTPAPPAPWVVTLKANRKDRYVSLGSINKSREVPEGMVKVNSWELKLFNTEVFAAVAFVNINGAPADPAATEVVASGAILTQYALESSDRLGGILKSNEAGSPKAEDGRNADILYIRSCFYFSP
jgi:hypothetical protein